MGTSQLDLAQAYERAHKKHPEVCDLCCDESEMGDDGTCRTCADDYHELEILAR